MAEKLNRDRSTRNQTRTTSGNSSENQNSSRRQYSSSCEENQDMRESLVRRHDTQNNKTGNDYPPLDDYEE